MGTRYGNTLSQANIDQIKEVLDQVLDEKNPPVPRCRLLSTGFEPYHGLYVEEAIEGTKTCLGCGLCLDSCAILRREPERREKTGQRTSLALESLVGEDCERCFSCALACPQVDTVIKDYIVDDKVEEEIPQLPGVRENDNYYMAITALVFGIFLGMFFMT